MNDIIQRNDMLLLALLDFVVPLGLFISIYLTKENYLTENNKMIYTQISLIISPLFMSINLYFLALMLNYYLS